MLSVTVDTLVDVVDANDGRTSLREAIAAAPANGSVVEFHSSLNGGTIELTSQLVISQTITITGPGAEKLTVDAQGNSRAFYVQSTVGMATISGLTITGGSTNQHGGGLYNEGSLTLLNAAVVGNRATIHGGGVFSNGPYLEINGSTIDNNRASWGGGVLGVLAGNEQIYITNSTIANNVADDPASSNGQGGGVRVSVTSPSSTANLGIHNSTISGNRAEAQGGGVHVNGQAQTNIRNATIVGNRADGYAGGVYNEAVNANSESIPLLMRNTILAANTAGDAARADGLGSFAGQFGITSRYNIVGVDHASFQLFTTNVNQLGSATNPLDPRLSPLTNVGGLTRVHVPLPGSPAVDRGADGDAAGLTGDQRGSGRFVEDNTTPNSPGNVADVGSVEFDARIAVGDFNGDGREDELRYSPVLKSLLVAEKAATGAGWEVGAWGTLALATNPAPTSYNGVIVGDFNGDGRDDVMIQDLQGYTWLLGISDGTLFHFTQLKNNGSLFSAGWQYVYVGDFDADGDEEIIGKVNGGSNWVLVEYNGATGLSKATTVGLSGFTPGTQVFVQDVNRDGKEDFITRANGSSPWMVNLSTGAASGTLQFASAADMNAWIGYGYDNAKSELNADKAMAKVIEEFAWVYNNVELELYPGLMKGPTATAQTKAGNNWDQAALLEKRLQESGVFPAGHVKIASGQVQVELSQLKEWLGLKPNVAASTLESIVKAAFDASATLINASTAIRFTHAWVQAHALTASGLAWVDLDPSWKMKDRADGIPLPSDLDNVRTQLGLFDEMSYLALDPTSDKRLPIEFFEDQVMTWLASSNSYHGSSLADLAYDGPIKARSFPHLPTGMGSGVVVASSATVTQHEDSVSVATNVNFAHSMTIRLKKGGAQHWTQTLAIPTHSLDSIHISFASSVSGAQNNPNDFAPANSTSFYSRLVVGGTVLQWGTSGEAFSPGDNVTIEIEHSGPQGLVSGMALNRQLSFTRKPGAIIAVGIDANQQSHESLAALQAQTLSAVSAGDSETQLRQAIDDLSAYAGAKYWDDFNRHNRAIERLTGSIGLQQWVGSGLVTADPTLLLDPAPEGANDYAIEYLPFGIAPANFGVDLPNSTHSLQRVDDGATNSEAWQLLGYNSSALEHNIVEEIISAGAVSTMKGLQQAFQRDMGLDGSGNQITVDVVQEYSRKKVNGVWEVRHVGNWYGNGTAPVMAGSPANVNITSNVSNYLLATTTGQLRHHNSHTTLGNTIVTLLTTGEDEVRILVPLGRTELNDWVGGVYLVEKINSIQLAIQADGGGPSNGGYSGGVTTAPPPELPSGNFTYAGYAGDPVHTSNGNMFRDETDIVFPNIGVPLTFSRHYDSQSNDDVGMGVGWTYSFSDMLYLDEKATSSTTDDEVVWLAASGARHRFKKLADGTFVTPAELKGKLVRQASNEYVTGGFKYLYLDPSGMEYHFQELNDVDPYNGFNGPHTSIGRLRMQRDQNGDGVAIDYIHPALGHGFTQIRDLHNSNRRFVFDYGTVDHIVSIVKYDGSATPVATWSYNYTDVNGIAEKVKRLISVTRPNVAVVDAAYSESNVQTTTHYDYYNNAPGDPVYAKGTIKKITEADGSWHTYEYYRNGRVFRVKQGEAGQTTSTAGVDVQTFNYNLFKNSTEFVDERGNVETYFHQKNGLQEKQIHADRSQTKTSWGTVGAWNEFLMASTTDERGAVETFAYYNTSAVAGSEFKHTQLYETTSKHYPNQAGVLARYDYVRPNAASQPHHVVPSTIVVDPNGAPDPGTGYYVGQPLTTTNAYFATGDSIGKLWKTTDAQGNVVEYAYYTAAGGGPDYRLGLLKSIKQPAILDPNSSSTVPSLVYETLFDYDSAGNVISSTTQIAGTPQVISKSTFVYDSSGNVTQTIVGANVVAERVVTESAYDVLGRLRETGFADANATIDPYDAYASRYKYDKSGRIRESVDPLGRVTRFEYDRQGNVVKQINPDGTELLHEYDAFGNRVATTDALKRTMRFVYDNRNRLIQTIMPGGAVERLRYDGAGNVVAKIDALGNATTFKYDASGRLLETKLPDPDGPSDDDGDGLNLTSPTTTNKYDKLGNLVETIDPEANVTQFKYDKLGRVVQTQTLKSVNGDRNATTPWVVTGTLQSLTTTDYDAVGNVIETAAYDVSQYDATATATLLADPRAQQTTQNITANKVQVVSIRYDALGRPVKTINTDGTSTRTEYDAAGRVRYQYDEASSVTEFLYDAFGRLEKTKLPDPTTGTITTASPTTTYQYDAVGNRITVTDARGNTTRFEYDLLNRLIAATNPQGGRTRSLYNVTGQLIANVDELGRAAYSKFNERGRVVLELSADPDGAGPQLPSASRFLYDVADRLTEAIDPLGYSTTYSYDRLGRLLSETSVASVDPVVVLATRSNRYDANGNVVRSTDELGRVTDFQFDELDRLTIVQLPLPGNSGVNGSPLPRPKTTTYYDGYGNVSSVVEHRNGGANQRTTTYEYDARNRRTAEVLDAGVDGTNSVNNYFNQKTTFQYDSVGNLEIRREYDEASGNFSLLRTTEYKYDKLGRLTRETLNSDGNASTAPTERVTLTTYDANGNIQTRTEDAEVASGAAALTTSYVYDALNRVISETTAGSSQTRRARYQYDAVGNPISAIDSLGRLSKSEYDRLGRLVKSIAPDPDGAGTQLSETTSFTYDAAGNLRTETNGAAETKSYAYDPQGRLIKSIDGRNDQTIRRYDKVGNLVELTDPAQNVTTYAYDGLNRKTSETSAGETRTWEYNALEKLAFATDYNGRATEYVYDRLGRKTQEKWYADRPAAEPPNTTDYSDQLQWFYDELGRVEEQRLTHRTPSAVEYVITDSYLYDGLDRIVEHSNQSVQTTTTPVHSSGVPVVKQTYGYAYDSSGLVETRDQYIAGQFAAETRSTYNAYGELVRRVDVKSNGSTFSTILDFEGTDAVFSYLGDGALAKTERFTDDNSPPGYLNRIQTNYAYDVAGRLKSISHNQSRRTAASWPANTQLLALDYAYDNAGRINSQGVDWNTTLTAFSTRTDETQTFDFDGAGQLETVDSNLANRDASYNYDANGNRSFANEPVGGNDSYQTIANNRVSQDSTYTYEYDDEGNLISRTSKADLSDYETLAWDHRNRLTKVERYVNAALAETVSYRYNVAGDLVYRNSTLAGTEHYLVESGQRTMAFEQDGDVKRRYQYGPTGEVLFDQVFDHTVTTTLQSETDLLIPLSDHQHSTRVVLAHAGDDSIYVRQSLDYAEFGRITATLGANGLADASGSVMVFGHHGSIADAATGLQLKGERWYSADLGRFVSEDPIQDGANWYMFAGNDPVNYADPSGLSMQGYPLNGGFSGNVTMAPTIHSGSIPANNVFGGAPLSSSLDNLLRGAVTQANTYQRANEQAINRALAGGGVFDNAWMNQPVDATGELFKAVRLPPLPSYVTPRTQIQHLIDSNAQQGIHVVEERILGGVSLGDILVRNNVAAFNYNVATTTSMSEAFWGQLFSPLINVTGSSMGGAIDTILPPSEPSRHVVFSNGTSATGLSGGPSSGAMWGQGIALVTTAGPKAPGIKAGPTPTPTPTTQPGRGFVLGETSELSYARGTADEQIAAFRAQQRVNRGQLLEAPSSPSPSSSPVYVPGRYSNSASNHGAYWTSEMRVFPTQRNSGLSGTALKSEQLSFFERGLKSGKSAAELRGQAAQAGYRRDGGILNIGGPDRLAKPGAEKALQQAIQNIESAN